MRKFIIYLMMIAGLSTIGCSTKQGLAPEEIQARQNRAIQDYRDYADANMNANIKAISANRDKLVKAANDRADGFRIRLDEATQNGIKRGQTDNDTVIAAMTDANACRSRAWDAEAKLQAAKTEIARLKNASIAEAKNKLDRYNEESRWDQLQATKADQAKGVRPKSDVDFRR
jgi:hypothetical protein